VVARLRKFDRAVGDPVDEAMLLIDAALPEA
jgi:hypothetical protein